MNLQLAQIAKMAYYEFTMHWRGRALLVVTLAIGVMNLFSILIFNSNSIDLPINLNTTFAIVGLISAPLTVALAILLPITVSDTIPKDAQYGVRELLDTLPLSRAAYLTGKVLGVWVSVLSSLLILTVATGVFYRLIAGPFDLAVYLEMWLFAGVSLVIINGSLGVLIPVGQPNRRRAVILMVAVFVIPFVVLSNAFDTASALAYVNPLRPGIIFYYVASIGAGNIRSFNSEDVALTIVVGLIELAIVWMGAWVWLRWKENNT
jgi:ABC-type transport system involved in multi-copper enzyme maturation permease subunit